MVKKTKALIFLITFIMLLTGVVNGTSIITINELIDNSKEYDKKRVTVQGEAIGEVLERGQYAWVNINDGSNAIGIWLTAENVKKITTFGDYKHKGDIVQITGVFHRACTQHGGDIDIHNIQVEIVENGYNIKEVIPNVKIILAIVLATFALILSSFYFTISKKTFD